MTKVYNQVFRMGNFPRETQALAKLMGVDLEMAYRLPAKPLDMSLEAWKVTHDSEGRWVLTIRRPGRRPAYFEIKKGREMYTTQHIALFREHLQTYIRSHM